MLFDLLRFSYLGLAVGFGWLSWRFWNNYREEKDIISENFSKFQFFLAAGTFLFFLGTFSTGKYFLFEQWFWTTGLFLISTGFSFAGYLVFYLKFPNIPPSLAFRGFFIYGVIVMFLDVLLPMRFSVFPDGRVTFFLSEYVAILAFCQILATALPLGIIIIQQGLAFKTRRERIKSLSLGISCILGVVAAVFYTLVDTLEFRLIFSIAVSAGIIILAGIATQKNKTDKLANQNATE